MKGRSLKAFLQNAFYNLSYQTASHQWQKILLLSWQPTNFIWSMATLLDKQWIDNDMDVMKLHNINAIRNNHHPLIHIGMKVHFEVRDSISRKNAIWTFRSTKRRHWFLRSANFGVLAGQKYPSIKLPKYSCGGHWGMNTTYGPEYRKTIRYLKSRDTKRRRGILVGQKHGWRVFNPGEMTAKVTPYTLQPGYQSINSLGGFTDGWTRLCRLKNCQ